MTNNLFDSFFEEGISEDYNRLNPGVHKVYIKDIAGYDSFEGGKPYITMTFVSEEQKASYTHYFYMSIQPGPNGGIAAGVSLQRIAKIAINGGLCSQADFMNRIRPVFNAFEQQGGTNTVDIANALKSIMAGSKREFALKLVSKVVKPNSPDKMPYNTVDFPSSNTKFVARVQEMHLIQFDPEAEGHKPISRQPTLNASNKQGSALLGTGFENLPF